MVSPYEVPVDEPETLPRGGDRLPETGQVVHVRARRYLVDAVESEPVFQHADDPVLICPDPDAVEHTLVRLSCLDDDAQGEPLAVLWESEIDARILDSDAVWKEVASRGFDRPELFAAYLDTLRWHGVTATNPKLFQAPYRAGIEVMAYQLEPLRKALALPRVNLFIADDVGLGKTIEAGLILRELLQRQKVRRVVVACPPSVISQWQGELEQRFGLRFVVFDRDFVQRKRRERGFSVNPWVTHNHFIISHALLRNEAYAGPLRAWLKSSTGPEGDDGGRTSSVSAGSLLILDEAHHGAPSSGSRYSIDSKFTRLLREVAPLFEHRLFLSATPHNGHSSSFSALLELLDPQRFCRGVPVAPRLRDEVLVRRLKQDLRKISGGFPERRVEQIDFLDLPEDAPELALAHLLDAFRALREERLEGASKKERASARLVLGHLQKRLISSIEAFARTLAVSRAKLEKRGREAAARAPSPGELLLLIAPPTSDDDAGELSEEEVEAETQAQLEQALAADPNILSDAEIELLDRMGEIAGAARGDRDRRVQYLVEWIRQHMLEDDGVTWKSSFASPDEPRRLLIFTEYTDTRRYLEEQLRAALADTDEARRRIATFVGRGALMGSQTQEEIRRAFNTALDEHPLRILIATEAAREGVNLQNHCAHLFHFDLPWNPSRIEQRNGRIDRKLQRAGTVYCYYFVFTQRPEDRVLKTLVRKTRTIREQLGSLSAVLEERLAGMLEDVVGRPRIDALCDEIDGVQIPDQVREQVEAELESARQEHLEAELDVLRDLMEDAKKRYGIDEVRFRHALSSSLELLGASSLEEAETPGGQPQRYTFPSLDQRLLADPTWAPTLDSLRAPRPRKMKTWEWRDSFPIRPVIFEDRGSLDADTVHLHLEHPVVQRLLHRFRGPGFADDRLSRATVVATDDPQRRVVLLGRLALYGPGASRLHEEILTVTARWIEPNRRKESTGLSPYARDTEQYTLRLLEESLHVGRSPAAEVLEILRPHVALDVEELLPHLSERAEWREAQALEALEQRGAREAREMEKILDAQRARIEKEVTQYDERQLSLNFNEVEADQVRRYHGHWEKRLNELEMEMITEPRRIKAGYRVQVARVEPVGIVYLWPRSG